MNLPDPQILEDFLYWYKPTPGHENLGGHMFIPRLTEEDISQLFSGNIPRKLMNFETLHNGTLEFVKKWNAKYNS